MLITCLVYTLTEIQNIILPYLLNASVPLLKSVTAVRRMCLSLANQNSQARSSRRRSDTLLRFACAQGSETPHEHMLSSNGSGRSISLEGATANTVIHTTPRILFHVVHMSVLESGHQILLGGYNLKVNSQAWKSDPDMPKQRHK